MTTLFYVYVAIFTLMHPGRHVHMKPINVLLSAARNGLAWPTIEHMRVVVCGYAFPIWFGSTRFASHNSAGGRLM